jgi:putative ABC transport system ATP-binding protein
MTREAVAPTLSLRNVIKARRGTGSGFHVCVRGLDIHPAQAVALTGHSGCGKSTVLDMLSMILAPDQSDRFVLSPDGRQRNVATAWQGSRLDLLTTWRRHYMGYVLQTGGLVPFLSVRENIMLSRSLLGLKEDGTVEGLVQRLGLGDLLNQKPAKLSVGERQRVAIARALAHRPAIVLADEPTASVDPVSATDIFRLLLEQVQELQAALVVASHDHDLVREMGLRELRHSVVKTTNGIFSIFDAE